MSKLDDLIKKLCPNGVEYHSIEDVANVTRGVRVVRSQLADQGSYPVFQNSLTPMGYYEKQNCRAYTAFVIAAGAAGEIGYSYSDFWAADDCYFFKCSKELSSRYLYHMLLWKQPFLKSRVRKASIPRLSRDHIEHLSIPVPPLPVQEEIVRILDSFTKLEAELEAELEARRRQYEYYRDKLLNFNELDKPMGGVKLMAFGEIFEMRNGYTPSKNNSKFWENGTIPWFRMEDIRQKGRVLSDSFLHITPEAVKGKGLFEAGSFILATTATIGEHALLIADSLANQRFTNLKIRKSLIKYFDIKFLFYYMFKIGEFCREHTNKSGFESVDMNALKKCIIPVPSIEEQKHIVSILDKFDSLVNDLTNGLPAEIKARRQQYEYYRDKLLSFQPLQREA